MLTGRGATVGQARKLRRNMSLPEVLLWRELRKRPGGHKWRRQHAAGPFVLDFVCLEARVALEIDGEAHDRGRNPARDEARDEWLMVQGYSTPRIPAREILHNLEGALAGILAQCPPLHHGASRRGPPPRSGED